MQKLHDQYRVKALVIGYDHRFGHNRSEGFDDYVSYGNDLDIEVIQANQFPAVSSSRIRELLLCGDLKVANQCLGYDYLLQGITENSRSVIECPYVFHTYVYAIENFHCYAPSLHNVCVMATLNDHAIFDFVWFMTRYSEIIYPLFVWNILLYRRHQFHDFTMSDMNVVIEIGKFSLADPLAPLDKLERKVNARLGEVRKNHQGLRKEYEALMAELTELGVTPQTTYLYVQGHHLFDNVVAPLVGRVCERLRVERETEIRQKACHVTQRQNELSAYQHSQTDSSQMMKKSTGYFRSAPFRKLQRDIESFLEEGNSLYFVRKSIEIQAICNFFQKCRLFISRNLSFCHKYLLTL
jgi:hypothetical protein